MNYGKAKYLIFLPILIILIYFLARVFSGNLILPQTFSLGPLTVHYYGLIMALAVGAGFYLAIKRALIFGLTTKQAEDLLFWVIVGGFVGARLYHVFSSFGYYLQNPLDVLKVWQGGLSIFGALFGGLLVLLFLAKSYKLKAISLLDWLTPSILIGQIIGRFGNLFNYEAFGYPTNLPWKMFAPLLSRPQSLVQFSFFHPLFLYEALGNLVILFIVFRLGRQKKASGGELFFSYLLLYNSMRFFLELLRVDSTFFGAIRLNSLASLILFLVGLAGVIYTKRNVQTP
jgi:phosphatidylglycerol:prolipoprotein diacylglycerol transferase